MAIERAKELSKVVFDLSGGVVTSVSLRHLCGFKEDGKWLPNTGSHEECCLTKATTDEQAQIDAALGEVNAGMALCIAELESQVASLEAQLAAATAPAQEEPTP